MKSVKTVLVTIIVVLASVVLEVKLEDYCTTDINEMKCVCKGNKSLLLPSHGIREDIINFELSSCHSVKVNLDAMKYTTEFENFIVENISDTFEFSPTLYLFLQRLGTFRLANIGRISVIPRDLFEPAMNIEMFEIENTVIEKFDEDFLDISITNFTMTNVTIERIEGLNITARDNGTFAMTGCNFKNITNGLFIENFTNVAISNCQFAFGNRESAVMLVVKNSISIRDSVFLNATIYITADNKTTVSNICADGMSSLRLHSLDIESTNNKLPTGIIYKGNITKKLDANNTVCTAGDCKCMEKMSAVKSLDLNNTLCGVGSCNYPISGVDDSRKKLGFLICFQILLMIVTKRALV